MSEMGYIRQLVGLYGGRLVTVPFRSVRQVRAMVDTVHPDSGAAALGFVVDWGDEQSIGNAARALREVGYGHIVPMVQLYQERGAKLDRMLLRALSVSLRENGAKSLYLCVAPELIRQGNERQRVLGAHRSLARVILRFEQETGCEVGVIFTGPSALENAQHMSGLIRDMFRARASGEPLLPRLGSTVKIRDVELGLDMEYSIVPPEEASAKTGMLSCESPVARALIGRPPGSRVEVTAPGGRVVYELLEVSE
jgi:hypothetical protein